MGEYKDSKASRVCVCVCVYSGWSSCVSERQERQPNTIQKNKHNKPAVGSTAETNGHSGMLQEGMAAQSKNERENTRGVGTPSGLRSGRDGVNA